MPSHAKLSPSGSERWMNCPAAPHMEEGYPDSSSIYAEEGTAAHEVGEVCLVKNLPASSQIGKTFNKCKLRPKGFVCDEAMADSVQQYLDHVRSFEGKLFVEMKISYQKWVDKGFGTSDAVVVKHKGKVVSNVLVDDLKYGKGNLVEAQDNSQLGIYSLGVYAYLKKKGYKFTKDTVFHLAICMPRKNSITQWDISLKELLDFGKKVKAAADKVHEKGAENNFNPGPKTCLWCKARFDCEALKKHNLDMMVEEFDEFDNALEEDIELKDPRKISAEDLAKIIMNEKLIKNWLAACCARGYQLKMNGEDLPYHKLVNGKQGDKKWNTSEEEVVESLDFLFDLPEEDVYEKPKIKTPTKVLALLGSERFSKADKETIESLYSQKKGRPNIAHVSDKRKEIVPDFDFDDEYEEEEI